MNIYVVRIQVKNRLKEVTNLFVVAACGQRALEIVKFVTEKEDKREMIYKVIYEVPTKSERIFWEEAWEKENKNA